MGGYFSQTERKESIGQNISKEYSRESFVPNYPQGRVTVNYATFQTGKAEIPYLSEHLLIKVSLEKCSTDSDNFVCLPGSYLLFSREGQLAEYLPFNVYPPLYDRYLLIEAGCYLEREDKYHGRVYCSFSSGDILDLTFQK